MKGRGAGSYRGKVQSVLLAGALAFASPRVIPKASFQVGVANGWVWGGHNWVGHIKPIYPFKTHLTNCF